MSETNKIKQFTSGFQQNQIKEMSAYLDLI